MAAEDADDDGLESLEEKLKKQAAAKAAAKASAKGLAKASAKVAAKAAIKKPATADVAVPKAAGKAKGAAGVVKAPKEKAGAGAEPLKFSLNDLMKPSLAKSLSRSAFGCRGDARAAALAKEKGASDAVAKATKSWAWATMTAYWSTSLRMLFSRPTFRNQNAACSTSTAWMRLW